MSRKAGSAITLILLLIGMSTLAFNIQPVRAKGVELIYDDGEADAGVSDLANKTYGWGVRFDHPDPGKKYQVQSAKIYIYMIKGIEEDRLRILIYLYQPSVAKYEKLLEVVLGGFSQGWNVIDLTSYDIVVDQNFIIGVNWARDYILHVGDDHDTACHSGGFNTTDTTDFDHYAERNFMIRAYVNLAPPPPAVGGEMILVKVDKLPRVSGFSTPVTLAIICTMIVSVAYVKHRKKQQI